MNLINNQHRNLVLWSTCVHIILVYVPCTIRSLFCVSRNEEIKQINTDNEKILTIYVGYFKTFFRNINSETVFYIKSFKRYPSS